MRKLLREHLEKIGAKGTWEHITNQIGMFSFTGLSEAQSTAMVDEFHVYMTKNGRISVSGLNENNVEYVANAFKECCEKY